MTATQIAESLSFTAANMAYLNSPSHRTGLRRALTAAGVYASPRGPGARDTALQAALAAYPQWTQAREHDARLRTAVTAAAEVWNALPTHP